MAFPSDRLIRVTCPGASAKRGFCANRRFQVGEDGSRRIELIAEDQGQMAH
jgi:hypothetical protein